MKWQKRPTSSSRTEQRQRDKLARKSQTREGRSVSLIVDDALPLFSEIDMVLRSCRRFTELMYWRDFEVTVDWTGVTPSSSDVCVQRSRSDPVEIVGNLWLLAFGDTGV